MNALTLLILALQLLVAVQNSPNLPPAFRDQAVSVALVAIHAAQSEIAAPSTPSAPAPAPVITPPPVLPPAPPTAPLFSAPIISVNPSTMSETPQNLSKITAVIVDTHMPNAINGLKYPQYIIRVKIDRADGSLSPIGTPVHMGADPANSTDRTLDAVDGGPHTKFTFTAPSTGEHVLTFTSGSLSTELKVNVPQQ